MSKLVNGGQTTLPTGAGGVVIDVGFAPKAVIVMLTGRVASSFRTMSQSLGCIVGTAQRSRASSGTTNNATVDVRQWLSTERIGTVWPVPAVPATAVGVSASVSGTEVTLTPSASLDTAYTVTWLAFGGDDVQVALRSTTIANQTTTTVNDCGFDPTCVLFASGNNATLNTTITNNGPLALGALVGSTARASGLAFAQVSATNSVQTRWVTTRPIGLWSPSNWTAGTATASLIAGGFSVNNTSTAQAWTWALCLRGISAAMLSGQLATTATDVDLTGAGFAPKSALAFGTPDTVSNDTNQNVPTSMVWGVALDGGAQVSASVIGGYDTNRTGAVRASASAGLVTLEKTGVDTYADKATATASFLSDGIRYSFSAGHGAAGRFGVLLFDGGPPTGGGPSAAAKAHYRRNNLFMEP